MATRAMMAQQQWAENMKATPIQVPNTVRPDNKRVLTSGFAGKVIPLAFSGLFREDGLAATRVELSSQMAETAELLLNGVNVTLQTWFVSKMAQDRFYGADSINRSYMEQEEPGTGTPIPWFETLALAAGGAGDIPLFQSAGLHGAAGDEINTDYIKAYNIIQNFRRKQVSQFLPQRDEDETTLAEGFWKRTAMKHVKSTFDQSLIDGEVPLNVIDSAIEIVSVNSGTDAANKSYPTGNVAQLPGAGNSWLGIIDAELQQNGVTVSLANLDLARETAGFARLRQEYQGIDDEYLIDLLMRGIRVPEIAMSQPMLLGQASTMYGMSKRWATDSANLDKSATNGYAQLGYTVAMPPVSSGGVVVTTVEVVPDQVYERQMDVYLMSGTVDELPDSLADQLDPEPVEIRTSGQVDTAHTTPDQIFGYQPLNAKWIRNAAPALGGKFYRDDPLAAWDENRNRIWAATAVDPGLTDDFYLVTTLDHDVFADTATDPFEFHLSADFRIVGHTYFGPALRESVDDYDKVLAEVDQSRLDPPPTPAELADDADEDAADDETQPADATAADEKQPEGDK